MKLPILLLLAAVAASDAASITQTQTFVIDETIVNPVSGVLVAPGRFASFITPFDPALGTLDSFALIWSYPGTVKVTSPEGGTFGMGMDGRYTLGDQILVRNGATMGASVAPVSTYTYTLSAYPVDATYAAGSPEFTALYSQLTGSAPVAVGWNTGITYTDGGINSPVFELDGVATMTMRYDYTPVPEASGMALLGAAGVMGLVRRRRSTV